MLYKNILVAFISMGAVLGQEADPAAPVDPADPAVADPAAVPADPAAPVDPADPTVADPPAVPAADDTATAPAGGAGPSGGFVEVATSSGLTKLIEVAGLSGAVEEINTLQDVTLFAPNDAAFEALMAAMPDLDDATIQTVLKLHMTSGAILSTDLPEGETEVDSMVPGEKLKVVKSATGVTVTGAGNEEPVNVVTPDVQTSQGVVHVIDGVLLPSAAGLAAGGNSTNGTDTGNSTSTDDSSSATSTGYGFLTYTAVLAAAFSMM